MRIPGSLKTYLHSLVGIAVAMIVIGFSLSFLRRRGPSFVQGPAGGLGNAIFGQMWNF